MDRKFLEESTRFAFEAAPGLAEKFVTDNNPSVEMNKTIADLQGYLLELQEEFYRTSGNRNLMFKPAAELLKKIQDRAALAMERLKISGPEDVNEAKESYIPLKRIESGAIQELKSPVAGDVKEIANDIIVTIPKDERTSKVLSTYLSMNKYLWLQRSKDLYLPATAGRETTEGFVFKFSKNGKNEEELKEFANQFRKS